MVLKLVRYSAQELLLHLVAGLQYCRHPDLFNLTYGILPSVSIYAL